MSERSTKRDMYRLIAAAFRASQPADISYHGEAEWSQWTRDVKAMSDTLKAANPSGFDHLAFQVNCAVPL